VELNPKLRVAPVRHRAFAWAAAGLGVLVLSLNEFDVFDAAHSPLLPYLAQGAEDVLEGRPVSEAFQARLLGPLTLRALDWIARHWLPQQDEPHFAMRLFFLIGIVAKNELLFALAGLHTRRLQTALALSAVGSVLFLLLSDGWIYTWDFFDAMIFTGLAYLIAGWRAPGPAFVLLFLLALPNRESAVFFGLWLVCRGAARSFLARKVFWVEAAAGAALIMIAVAFAIVLREWLLVDPTATRDQGLRLAGNFLQLGPNLATFLENLLTRKLYIDAWVLLIVGYGVGLTREGLRRAEPRRLAQGLFALALISTVFSFGILNEARIYLIFVPLLVFSLAELRSDLILGRWTWLTR
jgi:hypothetical protein